MDSKHGQVLYQQDGASSHTPKLTTKWLSCHNVERMPYPSGSPDINPIEPIWHELKQRIRSWDHISTTLDELKMATWEAWDDILVEDIDMYVDTMQLQVQAVLAARGGHTRC